MSDPEDDHDQLAAAELRIVGWNYPGEADLSGAGPPTPPSVRRGKLVP